MKILEKQDFTDLILKMEHSLYRVAWSILRNDTDCQDAVQETILRAWTRLPSLRRPEYFQTWLTRILIRECCRLRGTANRTVPLELVPEPAAGDGGDIWRELQNLPEPLRLPTVLHCVEGYRIDEVAKILKLPSGTVKSRLSRARKALQMRLEAEI